MKASNLWKTLTRTERRTWDAWAKDHPLLLEGGSVRRVSGRKAMTIVTGNRVLAGESANPAGLPASATWLDGALSVRDSGPFTENAGYIGFRCDEALPGGTKWFVWASALVLGDDPQPLASLRFLTVMTPGAMEFDDVVPSLGGAYLQVHGDWHPLNDPPENPPHWTPARYIWFRLHHYADGVLSPGRLLRGCIQYEL